MQAPHCLRCPAAEACAESAPGCPPVNCVGPAGRWCGRGSLTARPTPCYLLSGAVLSVACTPPLLRTPPCRHVARSWSSGTPHQLRPCLGACSSSTPTQLRRHPRTAIWRQTPISRQPVLAHLCQERRGSGPPLCLEVLLDLRSAPVLPTYHPTEHCPSLCQQTTLTKLRTGHQAPVLHVPTWLRCSVSHRRSCPTRTIHRSGSVAGLR